MSTTYPSTVQTFSDPLSTDTLSGHAALHTDINDTVEALQNKVGVDGDTRPSTLDKRVANIEAELTPVGSLTMFAGAAAPSGWLFCNGAAVSRSTYADLFAVVGTTYGAGNGSTTFNLPDLRDRAPVGAGTTYSLNQKFGATADSFTIAAGNLPQHTHTIHHGHANDINFTQTDHTHGVTVTGGNHSHEPSNPAYNFVTQDPNGVNGAVQTTSGSNYAYNQPTTGNSGNLTLSGTADGAQANLSKTGGVTDNSTSSSGNGGFANTAISVDVVQPSIGINFIIKV